MHLMPAFGALQLRQNTPLVVRSWVAERLQALRPKAVQNVHATLSRVLAPAIEEGMLLTNPCAVFLIPLAVHVEVVELDDRHRALIFRACLNDVIPGDAAHVRQVSSMQYLFSPSEKAHRLPGRPHLTGGAPASLSRSAPEGRQ